ncbi:MAG: hypothetical protein HN736_15585 [Anaerolineae bacterium]|jgi:hypothetical protein|nr:hypothetical protein [Anaerolineae bacterium]MBT4309919.1 hypothetical protein [Anaerolineae bacterium]MBT4457831.1 hypothetical protein [Anaerolineae bacterium]MBT4841830.1 hypothetical protein [Anaerolineae bacterium]MBT6061748.1 hypothetical protein [Anaerolineae bacterium]
MTNDENNFTQANAFHQPEPVPTQPSGKNGAENVAVRTVMTIISSATLGLALFSGAMVAIALLAEKFVDIENPIDRSTLIYKAVPIGITYLIGWIIALVSIRKLNNIVLPILINIYAWLTISGISLLYIAIIFKLYGQKHDSTSFTKYMVMMAILFAAFIGLHLLLKDHSLLFFSIPLLVINLGHLFTIVYHYVYSRQVINEFLWSDSSHQTVS